MSRKALFAVFLALVVVCRAAVAQQAWVYTDEAVFRSALGPRSMVDFDADPTGVPIPKGTIIDAQYVSVGVDFDPFHGGTPRTTQVCTASAPNSMKTVIASGGGGGFAAVFTGSTLGLGLYVCDLQDPVMFGPSTLELFDAGSNSIASFVLQDEIGTAPLGSLFFGVVSSVPIARAEFAIGSGDFVTFDDLQFGDPPIWDRQCSPGNPNSTGSSAWIWASGSRAVASNDLSLVAAGLPSGQFGYFIAGLTQAAPFMPPGSQGLVCLDPFPTGIARFNQPQDIIQGPTGSIRVDLASIPVSPPVAVQPGDTWFFQCWYRDANPGPTSNFTDAVGVTFL